MRHQASLEQPRTHPPAPPSLARGRGSLGLFAATAGRYPDRQGIFASVTYQSPSRRSRTQPPTGSVAVARFRWTWTATTVPPANYEAQDAEYFFGREQLVAELAARLVGATLLAVG